MTIASQQAYSALLARIQSGALPAGAYLVESDVALDLGVSRTPVREAIRRLAAEGLVQTEGRRRAMVREFGPQSVSEIYELRARLEGYAARRAAERIDAAALGRLTALAELMERAAQHEPADAALFADLNDSFHHGILEAADAPHLAGALRPVLQIQLLMLQRYRAQLVEHLQRSCWHHRELLRALTLRDPELAEQQMQLHMLAARGERAGSGVDAEPRPGPGAARRSNEQEPAQ
jgi:DNA-binding GntR family transcriptional regulator